MDYLEKLVGCTKKLIEGAIALLALAVVLQVLLGPDLPFFPVDVVGNIIDLTSKLGAQGLVGLVAIGVLIALFDRNKS